MKSFIVSFVFCFLFFSPLAAQLRYGLEFGAGMSNTSSGYRDKPSFYMRDGMFFNYAEKKKWIYETGLLYELVGVNVNDVPFENGKINQMDLMLSYLTLSLSLGYFWDIGKKEDVRLSVKFGVFLSCGIFGSGNVKRTGDAGETVQYKIDNPFRNETVETSGSEFSYAAFRRFDSGLFMTAEALRKKYSLRLTYAMGLRNMNQAYFENGVLKYSLSLAVGFYR